MFWQEIQPVYSEGEEYEIENNPVQSETRLEHQRLLEDDFPIFVPANPMQNNQFSCEGGIVEENVTPEGDVTIIFSNHNLEEIDLAESFYQQGNILQLVDLCNTFF